MLGYGDHLLGGELRDYWFLQTMPQYKSIGMCFLLGVQKTLLSVGVLTEILTVLPSEVKTNLMSKKSCTTSVHLTWSVLQLTISMFLVPSKSVKKRTANAIWTEIRRFLIRSLHVFPATNSPVHSSQHPPRALVGKDACLPACRVCSLP